MAAPAVAAAEETVARPIVKGTWSELAATSLEVAIGGMGFELGSTAELTSDGIGNWSLALPSPLADGTYDVAVISTDASGKSLSDTTRDELVIDARGPATPVVGLYAGEASPDHMSGSWDWQNATALTVSIPAARITANLGASPALTTAADSWTLALSETLPPGSYDVVVEIADKRGRVSKDQTRFELLVKEPPPPMKAPTVTVYSGEESPVAVTGSWDEDVAQTLAVSIAGAGVNAVLGSDAGLTSDGKGNWNLALLTLLPPGTYDVVAETTDGQGNRVTDVSSAELVVKVPPPPPYDCEGAFEAAIASSPIRFAFDRWDLTAESLGAVANAAVVLNDQRCLDRNVEVTGHADYLGGRLYNEALSIRRAQVVVDALQAANVSSSRLRVTGLGEGAPELPDRTRKARAQNRRVILTMYK